MLIHDAFSSIGVTLAILTRLATGARFAYAGRARSLAEYRRAGAPLPVLARVANADLAVSAAETDRMAQILQELGSLSAEQARLAVSLAQARHQAEGETESFLVTREHAATFRAAPGVAALRPGSQTSVPGLLLAGAWTDTGWPATLEGAVLSGHAAAEGALRVLGVESGRPPVAATAPAGTTGQ